MSKKFRDLVVTNMKDANVFLCGIPFDSNASVGKGAAKAPKVLRDLSQYLPPVDMIGTDLRKIKLYDFGDYSGEDFNKLTTELQFEFLSKDGFHIILGGDHSVAIASERAFYCKCLKENKEPIIIHLDAHPDICDVYDGSKYSHACPNYRAIEYGYEDKNITLIGIRGLENQEVETLKKHPKIDVFKAIDVKKLGVDNLVNYLINKYSDKKYLVYLSYDIDANDPAYAPGTGTPESFGLTNFETAGIVCGLVGGLNVDTMDLVEIAPPLDVNNITSWLGLKTIYEVFSTLIKTEKIH
ncbi:MAG: arginase family protein [Bacilli bacterium]